MTKDKEKSRLAFETWYRQAYNSEPDDFKQFEDGTYLDPSLNADWDVWQAALAQPDIEAAKVTSMTTLQEQLDKAYADYEKAEADRDKALTDWNKAYDDYKKADANRGKALNFVQAIEAKMMESNK